MASNVYKADDLEKGVRTAINGIAGMNFIADGVRGKLNIAAFLAQSMKETIKYDVCDGKLGYALDENVIDEDTGLTFFRQRKQLGFGWWRVSSVQFLWAARAAILVVQM